MPRLWAKIIRKNRIERQDTIECTFDGATDALVELCRAFDIPAPLWLNKHVREFDEFRRTQFLPAGIEDIHRCCQQLGDEDIGLQFFEAVHAVKKKISQ